MSAFRSRLHLHLFAVCVGLLASVRPVAPQSFTYPPEWAPHEAIWLGFRTLETEALRRTGHPHHHDPVVLDLLRALSHHVHVNVVIEDPALLAGGLASLAEEGVDTTRTEIVIQEPTFVWYRDPGPVFLSDGLQLAIADFQFSHYADTPPEAFTPQAVSYGRIDRDIANHVCLPVEPSEVVMEGGSICVNGRGTLILSALTRRRNPHLTVEEIEEGVLRTLGQEKVIWLEEGLVEDQQEWGRIVGNYWGAGSGGHTDTFVSFLDPRTVALAWVDGDERDANPVSRINHARMARNLEILEAATDQDGQPFEIVKVPMPDLQVETFQLPRQNLRSFRNADPTVQVGDTIQWVATASYLNYVITNGLVVVPAYWKPGRAQSQLRKDAEVAGLFQRFYPEREIVRIDPTALNFLGGGLHCLVQQQPAPRRLAVRSR